MLAVSSVASRGLGVLRDFVFSKIFGIGDAGGIYTLDAYYLAFRIPDLLYTLLIVGALSAAFIPLYTRLKKEDPKEANLFVNQSLTAVFLLLLGFGSLLFVLAPWFIPLMAPGFTSEVQIFTVLLTRILLISPIFLGLSGILQGVENVHKRFVGMALAPLLYNASIILFTLIFGKNYGVLAPAVGVSVGAFLHFLTQIPGALHTSFHFELVWPRLTKSLKEFSKLAVPRILGMSASQIVLLVDFALASTLALGALSVYSYALNLQSFPNGVVAVSFSVAIFSTLAEQALSKDKTQFNQTLKQSFSTIWFWSFPAVVGLYLLREPLIELILRGGAFNESAALMTEHTFAILIWSALPQSLIPLWSRAFYSLSDTRTPVATAIAAMVLNISLSLCFTLIFDYSVYGLALANLISATFNAGLLLLFLRKDLKVSIFKIVSLPVVLKSGFSALLMSVVILLFPELNYPHVIVELLLFAAVGCVVYLAPFKFKVSHKS